MFWKRKRKFRKVRIYQIEPLIPEYTFMSYANLANKGLVAPPAEIYKEVFDGDVGTDDLEEIYRIFNVAHPVGYRGRSLSMSDIVELYNNRGSRYFYCDTFGFKKIAFVPKRTGGEGNE